MKNSHNNNNNNNSANNKESLIKSDKNNLITSYLYKLELSTWEESKLLFARRTHRLSVDMKSVLIHKIQILMITITIAFAFSYSVKEDDRMTGLPYQAYMVLLLVSSYSFMIDYLLLPSEYLDEWNLLDAERQRGIVRFPSYILSHFLGQLPRGVLHVLLTFGPTYLIHSLNPAPMNVLFSFVCLIVGVESWQAIIGICAVGTSHIAVTNLLIFISFGGGTLFGGLLIDLENIPLLFRPFYYTSVTAVTQRALIVNDFLCCYLTLPCEGAAKDDDFLGLSSISSVGNKFSTDFFFSSDSACPDGVDSQQGNLGRAALEYMGLENVDNYHALFVLFAVSIVSRLLSVQVLRIRENYSRNLQKI